MNSVRWWKLGAVRILAIVVFALGIHGVSYNYEHHTLWDLSRFSGPTAMCAVLIGLALFILGFRTERDNEKLSGLSHP
jgi:NADH:ubiquinone oxidoreductase subunit K